MHLPLNNNENKNKNMHIDSDGFNGLSKSGKVSELTMLRVHIPHW
jgi:hypothetical protein